jgi:hypothetical protein
MNARLYDAALGRFFSPDPYVQMPDFSQNFNRYSYCLNNPLLYVDETGEFFWIIPNISWSKHGGLSIGISFVFGIPGGASLQAGIGYNFKSGDVNLYAGATFMMNTLYANYSFANGLSHGYSFGASGFSGLPVSTNFLTVGVNYNSTHNTWSGNLSAWTFDKSGFTFDPSVSAMVFPERTTNLVRGQGFRNNNQVLQRYVDNNQHQKALDYFGFEGTYNPNKKSKNYEADGYWGATHPTTGEISYGQYAFDDYATLYATYMKESYSSKNIKSGKSIAQIPEDLQGLGLDTYLEEINGYVYAYKRQGLYLGNKLPWKGIEFYQGQLSLFGVNYSSYPKKYQFIYKTPRKW